MWDNAFPPQSARDVGPRSKVRDVVMSVTTQIIFPYMSDARAPAMDRPYDPSGRGHGPIFLADS